MPPQAELRRLEKLRAIRHSARILNLIVLNEEISADRESPETTRTSPNDPEPFFLNAALQGAIFVKHNLRPGEFDLFDARSPVETKVIVPFDKSRLDLGARSFFLGERTADDTLRSFFKIDPVLRDPRTVRDMKVLGVLKTVPSFDPFILREALRLEAINVNPQYFSASYNEIKAATEAIYNDIKPLIEAALGKPATADELERFVEQVWNVGGPETRNLFFETLRIPRSEWHDIVFAWKALLYYQQRNRVDDGSISRMVRAMKDLRVTNNLTMCGAREMQDLKQGLVRQLFLLQTRARKNSERLSRALVNSLANFDAKKFRDVLRELSKSIVDLGTDVTVFEQVVSYYLYEFGQKKQVDGAAYEQGLRTLNEIVSLRFEKSFAPTGSLARV
jgi:hypothetical protein